MINGNIEYAVIKGHVKAGTIITKDILEEQDIVLSFADLGYVNLDGALRIDEALGCRLSKDMSSLDVVTLNCIE